MTVNSTSIRTVCLLLALVPATSFIPTASLSGLQFVPLRVEAADDEAEKPEATPGLEGLGEYLGGASLKTDPDLMARLDKAEQYRNDGNFRVAVRLWQSVLDESGDTLYTDDGETYFALARRIEDLLAGLTSEGLAAYRIAADADAAEILAAARGENDPQALGRVVKSYFMSSLGDDAAFRLGCLYLDRYDFTGSIRLFKKIVEQYPDSSIALDQVWLRIAVAYAWTGDGDSAREALAQAAEHGADDADRLYESVAALIAETPRRSARTSAAAWQGRLGGNDRINLMPSPPDPRSGKLRAVWQFYFEPQDNYSGDQFQGNSLKDVLVAEIEGTVTANEKKVIAAWRGGNWRPAGGLLFDQHRAVWKSGADLVAWNRDNLSSPAWRSLWLNLFLIDGATETWRQMFEVYGRYGNEQQNTSGKPSKSVEVQLFGDRIAQAMSIHDGVVYSIEGPEYDWYAKRAPVPQRQGGYNWGSVPRRTRINYLTAWELTTGKFLWRRPASRAPGGESENAEAATVPDGLMGEAGPFDDVGFMAAPVGYGELILAPVNVGGSIWLYAMHTHREGELVWKSYLCDEPGGGSQPWSPIQLTLDGSTVYAVCGTGVVFAVDAMTGVIRFARRYQRTGEPNNMMQRFGNQMELLELDGWQEDLAIAAGNALVVFASDYNAVWAIDTQTARFMWRVDNRPFGHKFDYVIGVHGDYVYLGGSDSVAAISLKAEGRWEWVYTLPETSFGQAMLSNDALYIPLKSSIQKLGLTGREGDGDVIATFPVELGTGAPLGNLYSDGKSFWVVGANRLYLLGDGTEN